jgi:hypothetical protein
MAANNEDEYIARLLKQDALNASKKYDFVGMDAFKRCVYISDESPKYTDSPLWLPCRM